MVVAGVLISYSSGGAGPRRRPWLRAIPFLESVPRTAWRVTRRQAWSGRSDRSRRPVVGTGTHRGSYDVWMAPPRRLRHVHLRSYGCLAHGVRPRRRRRGRGCARGLRSRSQGCDSSREQPRGRGEPSGGRSSRAGAARRQHGRSGRASVVAARVPIWSMKPLTRTPHLSSLDGGCHLHSPLRPRPNRRSGASAQPHITTSVALHDMHADPAIAVTPDRRQARTEVPLGTSPVPEPAWPAPILTPRVVSQARRGQARQPRCRATPMVGLPGAQRTAGVKMRHLRHGTCARGRCRRRGSARLL